MHLSNEVQSRINRTPHETQYFLHLQIRNSRTQFLKLFPIESYPISLTINIRLHYCLYTSLLSWCPCISSTQCTHARAAANLDLFCQSFWTKVIVVHASCWEITTWLTRSFHGPVRVDPRVSRLRNADFWRRLNSEWALIVLGCVLRDCSSFSKNGRSWIT